MFCNTNLITMGYMWTISSDSQLSWSMCTYILCMAIVSEKVPECEYLLYVYKG